MLSLILLQKITLPNAVTHHHTTINKKKPLKNKRLNNQKHNLIPAYVIVILKIAAHAVVVHVIL